MVILGNQVLSVNFRVRTFGAVLDEDLTFSDYVTDSIQSAIGRPRRLFRNLLLESSKLQCSLCLFLHFNFATLLLVAVSQ